MPLLCSNPSDISVHARDLPVAKSLPRPGSQPLCPHSSSAAHPEAPAGSGMCLLFPQPGTLFHASTASLPSFLQVLMCPPVISGVPWGVCLLFLPSLLPLLSHSFSHSLSPFPIFNYSTHHSRNILCISPLYLISFSFFSSRICKLHEGGEFCLSSPLNPQYLELCLDKKLSRWMDERMHTK